MQRQGVQNEKLLTTIPGYESVESTKPIGDRDLVCLGTSLKQQTKGIKDFKEKEMKN